MKYKVGLKIDRDYPQNLRSKYRDKVGWDREESLGAMIEKGGHKINVRRRKEMEDPTIHDPCSRIDVSDNSSLETQPVEENPVRRERKAQKK